MSKPDPWVVYVNERLHRLTLLAQEIRNYQRAKVDTAAMRLGGTLNDSGRCNNCGRAVSLDLHLTALGTTAAWHYSFCNWACLANWAQIKENDPSLPMPLEPKATA